MTGLNEFNPELRQKLETKLRTAVSQRQSREPLYAAFDADGTLWDLDVGENFFEYQIHECGLRDLPADPWKYYLETKKVDPIKAYVWLAQINQGQTLEQVQKWAGLALERIDPVPTFESQRWLVGLLKELGVELFVVTASVKWAVEPAAKLYGIDFDHVLGITTQVENGIVGTEAVLPITWRDGKAEALLKATGGVRPILCAGNTLGDTALLSSATQIALAVSTQNVFNSLYEEEKKLRDSATQHGWLMHQFRSIS